MDLKWQDTEEIAIRLVEEHPETDPLTVRFTDMQQDAEKVRQWRSRIAQRLNVPKRTPRLFARCGLAGRPF